MQASQRVYALKRMRKSAVVQCPEHVFCEQSITSNTAHPFCIRQYASFQVPPPPSACPRIGIVALKRQPCPAWQRWPLANPAPC